LTKAQHPPEPNGAAVAVRDLVKRYPKRPSNAVDGLTLEVLPGEIFGLLGPNGAGKTTTVGILTTRIIPTSGGAWVSGIDVLRDPVEARRRIGVVPQRSNLDRSLNARQNLTFHAAYHGVPSAERRARADRLLQEFGLGDRGNDKVDFYSGGMAQRLLIARALMHDPEVLFLDEPTTGLDPQARLFVWDRVRDLRRRGVTILLTTHDMDEAAELCDRVGIIDHGKLLALDTPAALARGLTGEAVLELSATPARGDTPSDLVDALSGLQGVEGVEQLAAAAPAVPAGAPAFAAFAAAGGGAPPGGDGGRPDGNGQARLRLYLSGDPAAALGPAVALLGGRGAMLSDVHIGEPTLEDVFISLTGRGLR
jgi:ABC-2 type transport system ATP-binding protein